VTSVREAVADRDEDNMQDQQVEGPESDQPVAAGQLVLSIAALDHRHAGHQEDLDQQQVSGYQAGQPAEGGEDVSRIRAERLNASTGDPQGDNDDAARPAGDGHRIAPPHRRRANTAPHLDAWTPGRRR
jgi:hypothetical protein